MSSSDTHPNPSRTLPLAGVAFTTLMVVGAAAFPMPPGGDVSAASKPAWLAAHYNAVIAQSYVRAVAAVAFIILAVAVAGAIRRATSERSSLSGLAQIGGAFSGGLLLAAQAMSLAAALFVHAGGNPDTVRALGKLQDGFLSLSSLPAVLLFAAAGLAAVRTAMLPRWLTGLSLLGVPIGIIDAISYDGGPLESLGILGLLYFLAWALLIGTRLFINAREADRPHDTQRPAAVVA